jgi:hypothetical protein
MIIATTYRKMPAVVWFGAALLLACLPACNKVAQWRNQQIAQSHSSVNSGAVAAPSTAVVIPEDVRRALPIDPGFTLLSYSDDGPQVRLEALSTWDAQRTSEFILGAMSGLGYAETDNPSNLLSSGLLFENAQALFKTVTVKVTLNSAEQCTLEITAQR